LPVNFAQTPTGPAFAKDVVHVATPLASRAVVATTSSGPTAAVQSIEPGPGFGEIVAVKVTLPFLATGFGDAMTVTLFGGGLKTSTSTARLCEAAYSVEPRKNACTECTPVVSGVQVRNVEPSPEGMVLLSTTSSSTRSSIVPPAAAGRSPTQKVWPTPTVPLVETWVNHVVVPIAVAVASVATTSSAAAIGEGSMAMTIAIITARRNRRTTNDLLPCPRPAVYGPVQDISRGTHHLVLSICRSAASGPPRRELRSATRPPTAARGNS
jgi:hypothetical protein